MTKRHLAFSFMVVGGAVWGQHPPLSSPKAAAGQAPAWHYSAEPYFQTGVERSARRLFEAGRCREARDILKGATGSPEVQYLDALCAFRLKQWTEAADGFSRVAGAFPPLSGHAALMAGRALEAALAFEDAHRAYGQVPVDSSLYLEARKRQLEVLEKAGRYADAAVEIQSLVDAPETPREEKRALLKHLVKVAERGRDKGTRERALLQLWAQFPGTPDARLAERKVKKNAIPVSTRAERAEQWLEAYRYPAARADAAAVLKQEDLPGKNACRALFVIGKSFRMERRHAEAVEVLASLPDLCPEPEIQARALFVLASSESLSGRLSGQETYERLARDFPENRHADDALYYAADLAVKADDRKQAHRHLGRVLAAYRQEDYAPAAAFRQFWLYYEEKNWKEAHAALKAYQQLLEDADFAHHHAQARYWEARLLGHMGQMEASRQLYWEVARRHPGTLYATWAQRRAGRPQSPLASDEVDLEKGHDELSRDERFATAVELARMKLPEARRAFTRVSLKGKSLEARAAFLQTLTDFGMEKIFSAVPERDLTPVLSGPINRATAKVFEAHRPTHMAGLLSMEAARSGVDLALVQGLVHRESGYNPKAMSPVGAVGLMQLMPDTARVLARRLSSHAPSVSELKQPAVNARFGTFYLSELIRRFDGQVELAVAAYNAGPARVDKWREERAGFEIDEFVESIPIKETRHYVKDVLGDRAAYRMLQWRNAVSVARASRHGG